MTVKYANGMIPEKIIDWLKYWSGAAIVAIVFRITSRPTWLQPLSQAESVVLTPN